MRAIADSACDVAAHYGAKTFYANAAGLVGVRSKGMFLWHVWDSGAGGYVVASTTAKRGWDVTQQRCESDVPVPVKTYRKRPRGGTR